MFDRTGNPLPSLQRTFADGLEKVMVASKPGVFTSVLPLMLLPQGSIQDIENIGPQVDAKITRLLHRQGLHRRQPSQPLADFIVELYGCVEDAPIGVLHVVVVVRKDAYNYPSYAPLDAVRQLEKEDETMRLSDLMQYTRERLITTLREGVRSPREDVAHIESRLAYLQLGITRI